MQDQLQVKHPPRLRGGLLGRLALCLALSAALLFALVAAGGGRVYSAAPIWFHYGISSPLDAFCLLLPTALRAGCAQGLMLARAALAAVAFCWYLYRHFDTKSLLFPALCTGYAAGVYTACIINVIWADAALLLPLLLEAVDRVLRGGRARRLALLTFCCVAVNCYTAWPVCLFCALYLVWQWFLRPGRADWPGFWAVLRRFFAGLLPGMALGLLCVAPAVYGTLRSGAFQFTDVVRPVAFSAENLLYCLYYGRYTLASASVGLPYLYTGVAVVAAALLYFFSKAGTRQKFVSAFALAGVLFSYLIAVPGVTWSNGADVAVFPFRYGFIFSAMLLVFAADTLVHGGPPAASVLASLLLAGILLLGYPANAGSAFTWWRFAGNALIYPAACFCLWVRTARPRFRRPAGAAFCLLLLGELYASSCITLYGVLILPCL